MSTSGSPAPTSPQHEVHPYPTVLEHESYTNTQCSGSQMTLSRVVNEMVLDGGGHFSPAGINGVHTLTLLFSSYTAHNRAEGNPI